MFSQCEGRRHIQVSHGDKLQLPDQLGRKAGVACLLGL
jgi:hypothetical protein